MLDIAMSKFAPLRIRISDAIARARQVTRRQVDGVSINLPFVTLNVKPDDTERRIANEIVIRLVDQRVLSASECCDDCVDQALASLQGIREIIVEKQVELYDAKDSALYLLLEMMAEGLREFLTFEQCLGKLHQVPDASARPEFRRAQEAREAYFAGLETLRAHLSRCLVEVAKIGGVALPKATLVNRYKTPWPVEQYQEATLMPSAPGIEPVRSAGKHREPATHPD